MKAQRKMLRYWGSYFKSPHAVQWITKDIRPAAEIGWFTYLVCCCPPENESWLKPLQDIGTEIIYHPRAKGNFDLQCISRVYQLCQRIQPDIFHCDNNHTSPLIGASFARVNARVWTKHSMEPAFELGRKLTLRDKISISLRISCYLASKVVAVSNAVKEELVGRGIPTDKILVLNEAIDKSAFDSGNREKARAALGYEESEIVITSVGHATPVKGWDILIKAFGEISDSVPKARLLMVGSIDGDHEKAFANDLRKVVSESNLGKKVRFTGHVPDVSRLLGASDIFVLPSRSEGWGLALVEGLAAGLPCIAAEVGAASELINNGENGFLFDREDYKELAKVLALVASDRDKRKHLAEGAIASKSNILGIEEYGASLLNLYQNLLKSKASSYLGPAT